MENYRGHLIYETVAGLGEKAFAVSPLTQDGVPVARLFGDFATIPEAKAFIDRRWAEGDVGPDPGWSRG